MKIFIIVPVMLGITPALAGSLPTVGPVPTAAGAGVSTHTSGGRRPPTPARFQPAPALAWVTQAPPALATVRLARPAMDWCVRQRLR